MLERMPNLPAHVVGFTASGPVSAEDYESVFIPTIEAAIKDHGKVRVIYHLGPGFTGFTAGALWDDVKVGLAHLRAWERIAMVTDIDWIRGAGSILQFVLPCEVKVFANAELAEAIKWVAA
ncbi:MAG: STAS/SEC14 domain-containing protein [Pseudomonadota bacterium]